MDVKEVANIVFSKLHQYIVDSESGKGKVLTQLPASEIVDLLNVEKWVTEGGFAPNGVEGFLEAYLPNTQHMHHPQYIGHQVATPNLMSGIADMMNGLLNNPMAIYEMGPAGLAIERAMINWLLKKVGWFKGDHLGDFRFLENNGGGVLTHGGSLANLTALCAARAAISPSAWVEGTPPELVVLCSENSHYSIERAISILGLGKNAIIPIAVNRVGLMKPTALLPACERVREQGKKVMAIVANACATSTGLYDPLDEIGQFCEEHQIWLHVDGAHGASALISPQKAHLMKGIKRADSLIWDMHKMMQTSALCAAVLLKDQRRLHNNFQQQASYLLHDKKKVGFDSIPFTIECTKSGMGVKLFWVLATEGEKNMANFIEHTYNNTLQFYELINRHPDFYCPYSPQSNILCFSYTKYGADNDFQLTLRNKIVERGNFYITSTELNGVRYLRLAVMNKLTAMEHIKALMEEIILVADNLKRKQTPYEIEENL